jgi:uncharacterized SAM-binding protein YcdF (DUF218 family)
LSRCCRRAYRALYIFVLLAGIAALAITGLCFTRIPYRLYHRLSADPEVLQGAPTHIVVLGGGGIPSQSGLVRAYHGAAMGRRFTNAVVIVALPGGEGEAREAEEMRREVVMRGVPEDRVLVEPHGRNTREQAMGILDMIGGSGDSARVLLVTSPEHMRRSLLTFRKLGFAYIAASAAFDDSVDADMTYASADLGGRRGILPDVGPSVMLRYQVWTNFNYLLDVARESCAMLYYRLRGWI